MTKKYWVKPKNEDFLEIDEFGFVEKWVCKIKVHNYPQTRLILILNEDNQIEVLNFGRKSDHVEFQNIHYDGFTNLWFDVASEVTYDIEINDKFIYRVDN